MTHSQNPILNTKGFTLVELLVSIAIVGILAALALTGFTIYKQDAEFAKAESDLRNARVSMEAGSQDLPDGYSLPLTYTSTTGGAVEDPIEEVLPEGVTSKDVQLGVNYESCAGSSPDVHQYIVAIACKGGENNARTWTKTCDGLEILTPPMTIECS